MITFPDQRGEIPIEQRLSVAILTTVNPVGPNYVVIDDEWFSNPIIPFIKIEDIFPPMLLEGRLLRGYVDSFKHTLDPGTLYLSVLETQVIAMNKKLNPRG